MPSYILIIGLQVASPGRYIGQLQPPLTILPTSKLPTCPGGPLLPPLEHRAVGTTPCKVCTLEVNHLLFGGANKGLLLVYSRLRVSWSFMNNLNNSGLEIIRKKKSYFSCVKIQIDLSIFRTSLCTILIQNWKHVFFCDFNLGQFPF